MVTERAKIGNGMEKAEGGEATGPCPPPPSPFPHQFYFKFFLIIFINNIL